MKHLGMRFGSVLLAALVLALFALLGAFFVALTEERTRDRIVSNEREALLQQLNVLVPRTLHDNDMLIDSLRVSAVEALDGAAAEIFIATLAGRYQASIYNVVTPKGYSGPIRLLVAIDADNAILGVRVTQHQETPGLGDTIELRRSDWILQFDGKSLSVPMSQGWQVRKDGGDFDQLTGATVTSRALVTAVKQVLDYHQATGRLVVFDYLGLEQDQDLNVEQTEAQ